jgi:hypothetical protein
MVDSEGRSQPQIQPLAEGVLFETQKSRVLRRRIGGSLAKLSLGQLEEMMGIIDRPRAAILPRPQMDDDGVVSGSHFEGDFGGPHA